MGIFFPVQVAFLLCTSGVSWASFFCVWVVYLAIYFSLYKWRLYFVPIAFFGHLCLCNSGVSSPHLSRRVGRFLMGIFFFVPVAFLGHLFLCVRGRGVLRKISHLSFCLQNFSWRVNLFE